MRSLPGCFGIFRGDVGEESKATYGVYQTIYLSWLTGQDHFPGQGTYINCSFLSLVKGNMASEEIGVFQRYCFFFFFHHVLSTKDNVQLLKIVLHKHYVLSLVCVILVALFSIERISW